MNRLMVHPLRAMAKELENISQDEAPYHQLMLPALHRTTSSACWCATTTAINRRWPRRMPT